MSHAGNAGHWWRQYGRQSSPDNPYEDRPESMGDLSLVLGGSSMTRDDAKSLGRPMVSKAPAAVVAGNAKAVAETRRLQACDALNFLIFGDELGPHAESCIHSPDTCRREYDALPYAEAEPAEPLLYAGTGIGALYGVPGYELDLEGWTLKPRSTR